MVAVATWMGSYLFISGFHKTFLVSHPALQLLNERERDRERQGSGVRGKRPRNRVPTALKKGELFLSLLAA